jgi:hypothetical protein
MKLLVGIVIVFLAVSSFAHSAVTWKCTTESKETFGDFTQTIPQKLEQFDLNKTDMRNGKLDIYLGIYKANMQFNSYCFITAEVTPESWPGGS